MRSRHAAVTIVCKNYLSYATTLAQSWRTHHPDHDFLIVLADSADGYVGARLPCGAEVVEIARFGIPDLSRFIYRYWIMEFCTAVKPFVLADLFERRGYETVVYLDPDTWLFSPLHSVYDAFEDASILLTPHIRRPYFDEGHPSDLSVLQSGTYNLGFIGLKNNGTTRRLLEWWMTKLRVDCVVDIARGLFVDQKWIDLVPGFFSDVAIIDDPGCNVAYWNLHERPLSRQGEQWFADGSPLRFFHFSGYSPFAPAVLSKHQNRHSLEAMPAVRSLTDSYGQALLANGYEASITWPNAFATLRNGVEMPIDLVRAIMQWASREGVPSPCPVMEPDAFCRFLMSRHVVPSHDSSVLLFHFLLQLRGDVAQAFPAAIHDHDDRGFRLWLATSGVREYGFAKLLVYEDRDAIVDYVADAFQRLRQEHRQDVFARFSDMWVDTEAFEQFAEWFGTHGVKQMGFRRAHADRLKAAVPGLTRILHLYFLRGDLQVRFAALGAESTVRDFARWLRDRRYELTLTLEDISLFLEFALASSESLEKMRFLYQHFGRLPTGSPGAYAIESRRREIGSTLSETQLAEYLCGEEGIEPVDHFFAAHHRHKTELDAFSQCSVAALGERRNFEFVRRLNQGVADRKAFGPEVNFSGYLSAPTGMGESARSMRATLTHAGVRFRAMTLPHPDAVGTSIPTEPRLFGWPAGGAAVSITVANADCVPFVKGFLPDLYWAAKNVGYWVWETEQLPLGFKGSASLFDEIWAPSKHSADALRRTIDLPVRVLRHALDLEAINRAQGNRRRFGLPEDATLFGFAFDPHSSLERKNVSGLIRAFRTAFRADDDCYLVLKALGNTQRSFEYERIRAKADWDHILFVEDRYSRDETFSFLKSLDAYVSLHRSEGFGLSCAEAMALGLPVVASDYSGNLEFMNGDNSLLVRTKIVETDRPYGPYPAGSRWCDPDVDMAASIMRSLLDEPQRRDLGQRGAASVRTTLDPRAIGAQAARMMRELNAGVSIVHKPNGVARPSDQTDTVTASSARPRPGLTEPSL